MMKKRLMAFGLAGVMLMGMSMNVFAADGDVTEVDKGTTKSATVKGVVPEKYTINIPTGLKDSDSEYIITAKDVNLAKGSRVKVMLAEDSANIKMILDGETGADIAADKTYSMGLKLSGGSNPLTSSDTILLLDDSKTSGETINATIVPNLAVDAKTGKKAGKYAGAAIFSITYEEGAVNWSE